MPRDVHSVMNDAETSLQTGMSLLCILWSLILRWKTRSVDSWRVLHESLLIPPLLSRCVSLAVSLCLSVSLSLSLSLSDFLSVCVSCLSVRLSLCVCLSLCPSLYLCLSLCLSVCMSLLSLCVCLCLSLSLFLCLSFCLCLSLWFTVHLSLSLERLWAWPQDVLNQWENCSVIWLYHITYDIVALVNYPHRTGPP